ncbi:MAG: hypothetical protein ACJ76X_19865, partial [Solirubrobacteraceae bacterium]
MTTIRACPLRLTRIVPADQYGPSGSSTAGSVASRPGPRTFTPVAAHVRETTIPLQHACGRYVDHYRV